MSNTRVPILPPARFPSCNTATAGITQDLLFPPVAQVPLHHELVHFPQIKVASRGPAMDGHGREQVCPPFLGKVPAAGIGGSWDLSQVTGKGSRAGSRYLGAYTHTLPSHHKRGNPERSKKPLGHKTTLISNHPFIF